MGEKIIEVRDFRKAYGSTVAVDGIRFEVERGEIFALLGPNGAGKTTTLECMEGLRQDYQGSLRVAGVDPAHDPHHLRNRIGVQLQTSGMPDNISVREAMKFFCAYHQIAPRYDLLERIGLADQMAMQYFKLSTGQKRRLGLALAVAHKPLVVILDEPTAGLDVVSRTELHEMLRELKNSGTTILLSSHDMAEVEKLADRIAILLRGKIAATGTPHALTASGTGLTKISIRTEGHSLSENIGLAGISHKTAKDDYDIYYSTDVESTVFAILEHIKAHNDPLIDLRVERPSLEDRFLEITNSQEVAR